MVVASLAHKFTAKKVIQQDRFSAKRQTTVNITQGANIRCVVRVSFVVVVCAKQNSSSIHDLIYLANVSFAQLLNYNHMPMVL
jgi:hypothetical protein